MANVIPEQCKGCCSYISQKGCEALMVLDSYNLHQFISDRAKAAGVISKCPCITCLVKSMCRHSCETFSKIRRDKLEKWKLENNTRTL